MLLLLLWCGVVLGTAYLLLAHFHSTITIHILYFLHRLGWDNSEERQAIWNLCPEFEAGSFTDDEGKEHIIDWKDWYVMAFDKSWLQKMIADLITCPICISFHIAFWLSAAGITVLYFVAPITAWVFAAIPFFALSAPIAALTIYSYVRSKGI